MVKGFRNYVAYIKSARVGRPSAWHHPRPSRWDAHAFQLYRLVKLGQLTYPHDLVVTDSTIFIVANDALLTDGLIW